MNFPGDLSNLRSLVGQVCVSLQQSNFSKINRLKDSEFKVYSQFGDDGIIQFLIRRCGILPDEENFVEFGVERYTESNTRFLLINNNWSGVVFDGNPEFIKHIQEDEISWRYDLQSKCCFVTPSNIEDLISSAKLGKLGLLSIDIDGMDYWVWKNITQFSPVIVVCEYNSIFGFEHKVTVPYSPDFYRTNAHSSNLYWGCSLNGLIHLAGEKGYSFVGSNSAGNNAYFVRNDRINGLKILSCPEGYVESKFRESRDIEGRLTFLRGAERISAIREMTLWNIESERPESISSLFQI